jgi:hypothetical protein
MKKSMLKLNLDDLRVESFETLPKLADEMLETLGGAAESSCENTGCFRLCNTGYDTVVCCYPTSGNGTSVIAQPAPVDTVKR